MPTIYSSLYQTFIRQGFAKSFTHGYAQSVVAATHPILNSQNRPSFARRNTNRFGRLQSLQLQSAFHNERTTTGVPEHRHEKLASKHGNLDAYFEALQKQQEQASEEDIEQEWSQFQFQRQIEWKPTPASILAGEHNTQDVDADAAAHDGETPSHIPPEAQAALAEIDAKLEKEIEFRNRLEALEEADEHSLRSASPAGSAVRSYNSPAIDRSRSPFSVRTATPPIDPQSQVYADHLHHLSKDGRYAEIPAVFEAMLVAGVPPIASSYNALLMAAIHLPTAKNEMVSKALDVYADMLRRKVVPDSDTYNILVGLLAARSLEVAALKKSLDDKRVRFGGMDEPGKFMFASHELEHAILSEDDRLDLAMNMFEKSVLTQRADYSAESYHQLISACAQAGRINDMLRLYEHMELNQVTPFAAMFPAMVTAYATSGDLVSAVECYNEYRELAIANDRGEPSLHDRLDAEVYASVIHAYIVSDKVDGAMKFYQKIINEYEVRAGDIKDAIVSSGFVKAFIDRGIFNEALRWAQVVETESRAGPMSSLATRAADHGDKLTAIAAFANLPVNHQPIATPAMALLALSVREGDVGSAARYWNMLCHPETEVTAALIEPTAMFAIALIGSGQVAEGLAQSEMMFQRIRATSPESGDEVEEGVDFVRQFMANRNIPDPREMTTPVSHPNSASPFASTATVSSFEDSFDPYAHNTDFKGSSLISDELEGSHGRKGPRLHEALGRFRNMRRAGRHPRYITYAKLISAASRENKMELCNDILAMARTDVPFLPQYAAVRYGWSSIFDAMIGACLNMGSRQMAEQYHQELLAMGAAPSANTFGLYITTLKEFTKTFDEASEAVKIFHRAKAEGVEPSSFLYNALIGKLGKARRIDDCLYYFAEMRALGIKPTSVTYGTIVNALCRVSDEKFAEELFDEMEAMPNYKARPAPYNSMMQFFLTTKRDKSKVLAYYERMRSKGIAPTAHTFKLLVDTHATLEPIDMEAAEAVLEAIRASGQKPEPVHFAALIHARGCNLHDMEGARKVFDSVMADRSVSVNASLFQALFEAMVANHKVADTDAVLGQMRRRGVEMTPYIANTLIHGWAAEKKIDRAQDIYNYVSHEKREPSTYEAMTRAYLAVEQREQAKGVVGEMLSRGYPSAVVNKVLELLGGGGGEGAAAQA
ncbi:Pentatricopeptide repeat-containing protein 5 [Colletotrichum sidae]|uniref:Pentatricopeptide repeat-containing protein 5 n=1 Tax=Colletotrichum sidae TaxID=1347389 RepID=A0A4R8TGC9_9PEZI|nr:Pentatricopeptide repeat-containing protein 5 [Colletotrichum sidae]